MDQWTFISKLFDSWIALVSAFVWPAVMVYALSSFKEEIRAKLRGLKRANAKTGDMDFETGAADALAKSEQLDGAVEPAPQSSQEAQVAGPTPQQPAGKGVAPSPPTSSDAPEPRTERATTAEQIDRHRMTKLRPPVNEADRRTFGGAYRAWSNLTYSIARFLLCKKVTTTRSNFSTAEAIGALRVLGLLPLDILDSISKLQQLWAQLESNRETVEPSALEDFVIAAENTDRAILALTPGFEWFGRPTQPPAVAPHSPPPG